MIRINYKLRYNKKELNKIYARITSTGLDLTLSTPFEIKNEDWFNKKGVYLKKGYFNTNTTNTINSKLTSLKATLTRKYLEDTIEGVLINETWIRKNVSDYFGTIDKKITQDKFYFVPNMATFIENNNATPQTKKGYRVILNRFIKFQYFKNKTYRIREVNVAFRKDFVKWGQKIPYKADVINKSLKTYKQVLDEALMNGCRVDPNYKNLLKTNIKSKIYHYYLTPEQRDEVRDYRGLHEDVRKLWLVGLHTGVRVGELMQIAREPIVINDEIEYYTDKTNEKGFIPIHNDIKEILYDLKPISSVIFNRKIKEIAEDMSWNWKRQGSIKDKGKDGLSIEGLYPFYKLITSKICRRTYITIRYEDNDHSLGEIRRATGHTSDKSVLVYLGKSNEDYGKREEKRRQILKDEIRKELLEELSQNSNKN